MNRADASARLEATDALAGAERLRALLQLAKELDQVPAPAGQSHAWDSAWLGPLRVALHERLERALPFLVASTAEALRAAVNEGPPAIAKIVAAEQERRRVERMAEQQRSTETLLLACLQQRRDCLQFITTIFRTARAQR
jgi:hypothetical protein